MGAYLEYQNQFGVDFSTEVLGDLVLAKMMFCAMRCTAKIEGLEFNDSLDEFLDKIDFDEVNKFVEVEVLPVIKKNMLARQRMMEIVKEMS